MYGIFISIYKRDEDKKVDFVIFRKYNVLGGCRTRKGGSKWSETRETGKHLSNSIERVKNRIVHSVSPCNAQIT